MADKIFPKIGDKLYLSQRTGSYMIDMVKHPYTVVGVSSTTVFVQAAKLVFNGPRYYDTIADDIVEDKNGEIKQLFWKPSLNTWGTRGAYYDYPEYAFFGKWQHQPYLD